MKRLKLQKKTKIKRLKLQNKAKIKRLKLRPKPKKITRFKLKSIFSEGEKAIKIISKSRSYASFIEKDYPPQHRPSWHPNSPGRIESYIGYIENRDPRIRKIFFDKDCVGIKGDTVLDCNLGYFLYTIFSPGLSFDKDTIKKKKKKGN